MPRLTDISFKVVSLYNGRYYQDRFPDDLIVGYSEGTNASGEPDNEQAALAFKFNAPREYWGQAIKEAHLLLRFYGYIRADNKQDTTDFTLKLNEYYLYHGRSIDEFSNFDLLGYSANDKAPRAFNLRFKEYFAAYNSTGFASLYTRLINDGAILMLDPSKNDIPSWSSAITVFADLEHHSSLTYLDITFGGSREVYVDRRVANQNYWNRHEDIKINWNISSNFIGPYVQKSAVLYWKTSENGAEHRIPINGTDMECIIPANTITTDSFMTCMEAVVQLPWENGVTIASERCSWVAHNTKDLQTHSDSLSPNGVFVNGDSATLKWVHISTNGTKQTKAEIQYRSNPSEAWKSLASVSGDITSYTVDADEFPSQTVYWRVRGYNADGLAGVWSEPAQFTIRKPPDPPEIRAAKPAARPRIEWAAPDQTAYQVKVSDILDSGQVSGQERSFQIMDYLLPGKYVVYVRCKNRYGLWSEYATREITVSFQRPVKPVVETILEGLNVILWVKNHTAYKKLYLMRDGVPAARLDGNAYTDYTAGAENHYTVRGVSASDGWADTELTVYVPFGGGIVLSGINSYGEMVLLELSSTLQTFNENLSFGGEKVEIAGKRWGVWEFSGNDSRSISASDYIVSMEGLEQLKDLCARHKTTLYRDAFGNRIWGVVTQLAAKTQQFGDKVLAFAGFTFIQVDYSPSISYDPPEVTV